MTLSLCILGSTGSIGTQTLDVIRQFPERFSVRTLAAGKNISRLAEQIIEFQPETVSIQEYSDRDALQALLKDKKCKIFPEILFDQDGLSAIATHSTVDAVVVGLVGLIGLAPTLAALKAGKRLLTANKETFVAGGHLVKPYLSQILPIDSEHSAIHQCLAGKTVSVPNNEVASTLNGISSENVQKLILTASGGPFRTCSQEQIEQATLEDALKHPNWVMGQKITIDSASLMNKGLEVIEAHWLFALPYDSIEVIIHPQSTVHSGVEFVDGSILFQLGATDMKGPIQYALTYPERLETPFNACRMSLVDLKRLDFEPPDTKRFPCLRLAYQAGQLGGSATAVLNAADEKAVELLLKKAIAYKEIPALVEAVLELHQTQGIIANPSLQEILSVDKWAREQVESLAQHKTALGKSLASV